MFPIWMPSRSALSPPGCARLPVPNGMLECSDVTDTVVHLVSDAGRYVTGQTVVLDAGFTNYR